MSYSCISDQYQTSPQQETHDSELPLFVVVVSAGSQPSAIFTYSASLDVVVAFDSAPDLQLALSSGLAVAQAAGRSAASSSAILDPCLSVLGTHP
jgi:hypothetical protein